MKRKLFFAFIINFICTFMYAEFFFSGFAGGKLAFLADQKDDSFNPNLVLDAFFSGQFNISNNIIIHTEFSIKTDDLIDNSVFKANESDEFHSKFQIDELSVIFRKKLLSSTNYFSVFAGTYEPIGSDIFLRRQFGIKPICSKITESWLGLAGSIIYPLFGIGASDIVHFDSQPIATGIYVYLNDEMEDTNHVLNTDARFACVYRFFALDFSAGVGFPLVSSEQDDAFFIVDSIYGRAGLNMLIGNAYTTSFFAQAGFSELPFKKKDDSINFDDAKLYFLFEPRFRFPNCQIDLTAFSLPENTVKNFIFINEKMGINLNVFTDTLYIKNKSFIFGVNGALTFQDKDYSDLSDFGELFSDFEKLTIATAPYFQTNLLSGELHAMLKLNISKFINDDFYKGFVLSLGYKAQF